MTAAGVLPALAKDTVLVSDFWAPYWSFDVLHAVCGAHLGRELVAAAEVPGQAGWAEAMDRLLVEINRTTGRAATPARTLWPPRCWATTGAATTSWSRPAGRPTLNTVPGSAGTAPTQTRQPARPPGHPPRRGAALRRGPASPVHEQRFRARCPPPEDPYEGRRMPAHHGRRPSVLPVTLIPVHGTQARPVRLRRHADAPRRHPMDASHHQPNQLSSYQQESPFSCHAAHLPRPTTWTRARWCAWPGGRPQSA